MKVLIVEDEGHLAEALQQILIRNGFPADVVSDGVSGLDNAMTGIYDAVILDIMLPKMDGLEVLRRLRNEKISTPVLLLTAKDELNDKVKGLDLGADDYLTKPFAVEELLARLRALTRRLGEVLSNDAMRFEDISLNLFSYELSCNGASIKLGMKEFQVLELLMRRNRGVVEKEEILERVWGFDSDAEYNNVEVYVSFLRKKLSNLGSCVKIKAMRGVGYSLDVNE